MKKAKVNTKRGQRKDIQSTNQISKFQEVKENQKNHTTKVKNRRQLEKKLTKTCNG